MTSKTASSLPVRDGERPWTAKQVADLVAQLESDAETMRTQLAEADAEIPDLMRNFGEGSGDDQADYGSSALEREQELTMVNNTRDMLEQTESALQRLQDGTFGVCESCGGPIGKARLQAYPRAAMCVACKQRQERR